MRLDLIRHFEKIEQLNRSGSLNAFVKHLSFLRNAKFPVKPKWLGKFSRFSTTISSKRVWLANTFTNWPFNSQVANLLHESVHQRQYVSQGYANFAIKYAQKDGRLESETEANLANIEHYLKVGLWHGQPIKADLINNKLVINYYLEDYLNVLLNSLQNDYLLGSWFDPVRRADTKSQFTEFIRKWLKQQ